MAASAANPEGTSTTSSLNDVNPSNGGDSATPPPPQATGETSSGQTQTQAALRHNPGISIDWTAEEQSMLEDLLDKYASDTHLVRYAKIATKLKEKTVRDVALRCRWMTKKENGKRRKEDHNSTRKSKERKERAADPSAKLSQLAMCPNGAPYAPPMIPVDTDDGISYQAIGGEAGQLLEQNSQVFGQISSNFAAFQIQENIRLFCQTRDNIHKILNDMNNMPEVMKLMPPLPVKIHDDMANSILPRSSLQKKS